MSLISARRLCFGGLIGLLCWVGLMAAWAEDDKGREWFVAERRISDAEPDGTLPRPFFDFEAVMKQVSPGDTVTLLPGNYPGGIILPPGAPERPITLRAAFPGRTFIGAPVIVNQFEPVEGLSYTFVAECAVEPVLVTELTTSTLLRRLSSPEEVQFLAGSFYYDRDLGKIYIHASDSEHASGHRFLISIPLTGVTLANHTRVEGLALSGFGEAAIAGREVAHVIIRNCWAYGNGYAVYLRGAEDCRVTGNHFWNNSPIYPEGSQIHITQPHARRVVIDNNRVHDSPRYGIRFYSSGPTEDCMMRGNLVWGNSHGGMYYKGGQGENQEGERNVSVGNRNDDFRAQDGGHNTYGTIAAGWQDNVQESDLVVGKARPPARLEAWRFADPSCQDYRLQSDSPARKAGPDGSDLGAFPYQGDVLYVGRNGRNDAEGTAQSASWQTLAHATATLRPGQTLYLLPGSWEEPLVLRGLRAESSQPTRIRVLGKGRATLPEILVEECENLILEGLTAVGPGASFLIRRSTDVRLERCLVRQVELAPSANPDESRGKSSFLARWFHRVWERFRPQTHTLSAAFTIHSSDKVVLDHCAAADTSGYAVAISGSRDVEILSSLFLENKGGVFDLRGDPSGFWSDFNVFVLQENKVAFASLDGQPIASLEEWQAALSVDLHSHLGNPEDFPGRAEGDYRVKSGVLASMAGRFASPVGAAGVVREVSREPIEGMEVISTTPTSVNLAYWTPGRRTGTIVEWGETAAYGQRYEKASPAFGEYETFHSVSLLGLRPETKYHYRVGFRDYDADPVDEAEAVNWSEDFTFTTGDSEAAPRNLHVATDGSDLNDGLSPDRPWRTLAHSAREAGAGDTVTLAPGHYPELLRPLQTGTDPERRITFRAERPLTVLLDGGSRRDFEGRSHAVQIMNKAFITLENLSFAHTFVSDNGGYRGGFGYGSLVLLSGAPGTLIQNCFFDGRGGYSVGIMAFGNDRLPGVASSVPEVRVEDSIFYRNWWSAVVYSDSGSRFENNAFVRGLILLLSGHGPARSMVMRNNIYQSLIPTKNRNRWFAKPELLDSDYNCFVWDDDNQLRHVAYLDREKRTYAHGLAGWQKHFGQDASGIEAEPGYPLSRLAGFGSTEKQDPNRLFVIADMILPPESPCRGAGELGEDIGPRWERFLEQESVEQDSGP